MTMKSLLLVLSHLAIAAATDNEDESLQRRAAAIPQEHELEDDGIQWTKRGNLRRLQAEDYFGADDPYFNPVSAG